MDCECKKSCVEIGCKRHDEQICKNCDAGEVEDIEHFLLYCTCMIDERRQMEKLIEETVDGWLRWRIRRRWW